MGGVGDSYVYSCTWLLTELKMKLHILAQCGNDIMLWDVLHPKQTL